MWCFKLLFAQLPLSFATKTENFIDLDFSSVHLYDADVSIIFKLIAFDTSFSFGCLVNPHALCTSHFVPFVFRLSSSFVSLECSTHDSHFGSLMPCKAFTIKRMCHRKIIGFTHSFTHLNGNVDVRNFALLHNFTSACIATECFTLLYKLIVLLIS